MNRAIACFANFIGADQHHGRAYWTIAACILAGGLLTGCGDINNGDEVPVKLRLDPGNRCRIIITRHLMTSDFRPIAAIIEGCTQ